MKWKKILLVATAINTVVLLIVIVIKIGMILSDNRQIAHKFNNHKELICTDYKGFNGSSKYIVSKQKGWKFYNKEYFIKDDFLIKLENCK